MTDENGNLSIDFLAGFTIFMLAFIWVVSMIPGLMIGLQSYTIDYDAVAYRTGVILVEDPGWPVSPPWESFIDQQKSNVTRFGLAISKDTPNILSEDKVNRFFCATAFIYPDDYRSRVIFGDYPYGFNISLIDDGGKIKSVGDVLPNGYGYIRRPVKIKGASNATINQSYIQNNGFTSTDNATTHIFSILIDNPKLLGEVTDPAYQIDPAREQITINITDIRSTITNYPPVINNTTSTVILSNIRVFKQDGGAYSSVPLPATDYPYIDGSSSRVTVMPAPVTDNITLRFSPQFFDRLKAQSSRIYIALGFTVSPESTFLNNTQALPDFNTLDGQLTFNNPNTTPFYYDYNTTNVTQPHLRDAVVEVAVWSGAVTSYGGGGPTPINGTHTIYASAGSGGTISPIGSVIVSDGANQPFTITNNTGYHISDIVVDGVPNGTIPSYTFTNVNQDHTITASFAIDTFTITPSAGANGTITPSTPQTVSYGSTPTFTLTPDPDYQVADVLVDNSSVGAVPSYTFLAVTANRTINVSFTPSPPVAAFDGTPVSGSAPLDVVFTDASTGSITAYAWDFDNDGTIDSILQNPSHTYATDGIYTVNLTVTGPGGSDVELKTNYITAAFFVPPPVAAFSGTPLSGNSPLNVQFTDASTGSITAYAWDFDNDGTIDSILQSPLHTYATAGTYTVNLTVTGPGGSDVELKTNYITVYNVTSYTTVGTTSWTVPAGVTSVEYLVVAGGGGGAGSRTFANKGGSGGGGAGGLITGILAVTPGASLTVTVGAGGAGGAAGINNGINGGNSVFSTITSTGGGYGAVGNNVATSGGTGGSGGGGYLGGAGGAGISGQGYAGGSSLASPYLSGGGGGSSQAGSGATGSAAGKGGDGTPSSISGSSVTYAGGGGGGSGTAGIAGALGGSGGGGAGGALTVNKGTDATGYGSGGGGGTSAVSGGTNSAGGNGSDGIVIIKYTKT
jgi:PKD repeat protein